MARTGYVLAAVFFLAAIAPCALHAADDDDSGGKAATLMVTADFNRDGVPDVAEIIRPDITGPHGDDKAGRQSYLTLSLGRSGGEFTPIGVKLDAGSDPQAIATADFNRDGVPDVLVGDADGAVRLFLGDGKGGFTSAGVVAHLDSVVSIAVADFNHDGIPDIAVTDWHSSKLTVLLGDGSGNFRANWSAPLRLAGTSPRLTTADFNRDGLPDLAVVYGDDGDDGYTYDILLDDGNGNFVLSPTLSLAWDPITHCAP